jgi:hypothetical protein
VAIYWLALLVNSNDKSVALGELAHLSPNTGFATDALGKAAKAGFFRIIPRTCYVPTFRNSGQNSQQSKSQNE